MVEQLSYRMAREDDLPGIMRLWAEHSGWGALTPAEYRHLYLDAPYGPSLTPLAIDEDGSIAGLMKFVPCLVAVEGAPYRALRMHAMILRPDVRLPWALSRAHPLAMLCATGLAAAAASGYSVVYSLPHHPWQKFFAWLGMFSAAEFGCLTLPVASAPLPVAGGLTARLAGAFGPEYQDLWECAARTLPVRCGVRRDPVWLGYKNDSGHFTVEIRDAAGGALLGYCRVEQGIGLITDLLARSCDALPAVLRATTGFLLGGPHPGVVPIRELRAMQTPFLDGAFRNAGFAPAEYRFAFVSASIDPALPADQVAPDRWYILPGG